MDDMRGNFFSFEVNNHGQMTAEQLEHDGSITVTVSHIEGGYREYDSEFTISPGDFVMLMNYYRYQKEHGNPIF